VLCTAQPVGHVLLNSSYVAHSYTFVHPITYLMITPQQIGQYSFNTSSSSSSSSNSSALSSSASAHSIPAAAIPTLYTTLYALHHILAVAQIASPFQLPFQHTLSDFPIAGCLKLCSNAVNYISTNSSSSSSSSSSSGIVAYHKLLHAAAVEQCAELFGTKQLLELDELSMNSVLPEIVPFQQHWVRSYVHHIL
jgi:hypothetical protein